MGELVTVRIQAPPPSATVTAVPYETILAHPEQYFQAADIVWVMAASAMVFLMVPALSLIYAGLSNRSFAMTMFRLPLMTAAVVGLEWVLWGYSLTFTDGHLASKWYGGETRANVLVDAVARPIAVGNGDGAVIPELLFVLYEGMFASFTAAIVCGGIVHRARPARFLIFITFWSVLVYCPVARWTWHRSGWSNRLGILDFAGGTPVHITSGTTVAAFAIFYDFEISNMSLLKYSRNLLCRIWKRIVHNLSLIWVLAKGCFQVLYVLIWGGDWQTLEFGSFDPGRTPDAGEFEPYSNTYLVLGTALLWFGWAGFNGGSALGANLRAVSAWLSTHTAACAGGVTGMVWQWNEKLLDADKRKPFTERSREQRHSDLTVISFCDGAIAGMVAITPGSGFVPVWSAVVFGIVAAIFVGLVKKESAALLRHDKLHVFAVHAGAGLVGMCLTGVFADSVTIGLDGHSTLPNPEYSKGRRLGYQLADVLAAVGYTFFMTISILNFMKFSVFVFKRCLDPTTTLEAATGYYIRKQDGSLEMEEAGEPKEGVGAKPRPRIRPFVDDLQATESQRWREEFVPSTITADGTAAADGNQQAPTPDETQGGAATVAPPA
ncbi:ammonium transporter AmtB-like domain-containing protein [Schizothecium vesticola]|uniref:Ammonium transporter AmtB-like domain-containing protein n=1 Tax=Schizothecium vesticola TaxID=314040 RepID=A0AA40ELA4_9PEZI|nr:ammonium transporter AmtB-like domain-containing protein [Schizothecium vesticola]